jgi:hypothetical protein
MDIESGDSVKHHSNTLIGALPMTVFTIENGKAECGYVDTNHKLVSEWYKVEELIVITKGNTHG